MGVSVSRNSNSGQKAGEDIVLEDVVQIVLLAQSFDNASLFNIPKDIIRNILHWCVLSTLFF
jgi:hypothetical protein